ncbi:MAG TPA: PDZ domain-containing protein [Bryobacteraceae bacterium]|nr:PDZ domain-containing protein [Bryobacteraceae bacterium]
MSTTLIRKIFRLAIFFAASPVWSQTFDFTVFMDPPVDHYYHVELRCEGLHGATQDFKMPVWMPGYYRIMDYSKDVANFKAADGAGHSLGWTKINKNTWRVTTAEAAQIVVSYDVYAFTRFVGNNYLDDQRGYFVGPGMYVYLPGMIDHPATVHFKLPAGWLSVANGLDPVAGQADTFFAPDFDLLYDCPTLLGNQEHFQFEVNGVPHSIVAEDLPASIDRAKIAADLKKIVEAATSMMGEIPYKHYTFLLMGRGAGGVEHLTSAAMLFDGASLNTADGYRRWLSFAAHEYFHTYNVKRIRPVALGPFDYDRENFTTMLWEAEGFTSYYQDLLVERAGLMTPAQYFATLSSNISAYENSPGHLFQSAAQSSIDTWIRGDNAANTTISYYNKGPAIAAMLDYKIRAGTGNRESLDDVMRALYNEYFKQKKRGFTDQEFRAVCERIAGAPLAEIFDDYVATTKEIDYRKYFALAGLKIDTELRAQPAAYLGAVAGSSGRGGRGAQAAPNAAQVISHIDYDSPAARAGLSVQDEILSIDGVRVANMNDALRAYKPGDRIRVLVVRDRHIREIEVVLGSRMERSFKIEPVDKPNSLQSVILQGLLK